MAIVALAFAAGYGGRLLLSGDDGGKGSPGIEFNVAAGTPIGISREELTKRFHGVAPVAEHAQSHGGGTCLFYDVVDHPSNVWVYCFNQRGKLATSRIELR